MRSPADENVPLPSVRRLRVAGHDVAAVIESAPGAPDSEVIRRAADQNRVLLTFDRDHGELVYRGAGPLPPGVVYLRMIPGSPEEPADMLLAALLVSGLKLQGHFTVVGRHHVRQRPLPLRP